MISRPYKANLAYQRAFIVPVRCTQYADRSTVCKDSNGKIVSRSGGLTTSGGTLKATGSASIGVGAGASASKPAGTVKEPPRTKNTVSGCQNCKEGDIWCGLGKLGCEGQAAIFGTANGIQTGVGGTLGNAGKTIVDVVGGNANAIQQAAGSAGKTITDSVLGTSNLIQDSLGKAGWDIQQGPWTQYLLIGGAVVGVILLITLLRR